MIDDGILLADGFNKALIGIGRRSSCPDIAVYDVARMVRVLTAADGMSFDDAMEYLEFHTFGAWVGDRTPIYVSRRTSDQIVRDAVKR